jgi:hypothetical protein
MFFSLNRKQPTIKSSIYSKCNESLYENFVPSWVRVMCFSFALLSGQQIFCSDQLFAEETGSGWRRTKQGWVEMNEVIQHDPVSNFVDRSNPLAIAWPAAAAIFLGCGAYWLLTIEITPEFRRFLEKIRENSLWRIVRQYDSRTSIATHQAAGLAETIPLTIKVENHNQPRQ